MPNNKVCGCRIKHCEMCSPSNKDSDIEEALRKLITQWEAEGEFLSNPEDCAEDKAAGQTYFNCVAALRGLVS